MRWEYTKATRNGEQLTLRRCAECWTRRDAYPHLDNGYQPASEPYQHAPDCQQPGEPRTIKCPACLGLHSSHEDCG